MVWPYSYIQKGTKYPFGAVCLPSESRNTNKQDIPDPTLYMLPPCAQTISSSKRGRAIQAAIGLVSQPMNLLTTNKWYGDQK